MRYNINITTVDYTASTTLMPEKNYGAWLAINTGTASAFVCGYELQPGEGLSSDSICQLLPGDVWKSPIQIIINTGAKIRISRSQATPINERR